MAHPTVADRPPSLRSRRTNHPLKLPGIDGRSAEARRRRDLVAQLAAEHGGLDGITKTQVEDVVRAADLMVLAERARALAFRRGAAVDVGAIVRLEAAADRALQRLRSHSQRRISG